MATTATAPAPTSFAPFSSSFSPAFWEALTQLKLHKLQLSDAPVPIVASYARGRSVVDRKTGDQVGLGCTLDFDATSFQPSAEATSTDRVRVHGVLRNFNTIEDFKNSDKNALLQSVADQVWKSCNDESDGVNVAALNPFLILTFADLKKYRYWYWCGFPALLQKPGWETAGEWQSLDSAFSPQEVEAIAAQQELSTGGAVLAKSSPNGLQFSPLHTYSDFFRSVPESERTIVFADPSSHPSAPGWPLRNVLSYLSQTHGVSQLRVVSYRDTAERSKVAFLQFKAGISMAGKPGMVGWEKNDKGALGPRMADLAPLMDPSRLADQAVDLNLQLMRWRIMPSLDLEKVKHTKVLLLGAGTLGCYVARTLMAWGVRKITLVDSSTVSFSNPVRQPLFEFEDSLAGGKPKAEAAAASLKRIYPGVDATGIHLSIPMPGHPIPPSHLDRTKEDVKTLESLIEQHDVVYLLMDSRESRWLPTVIGAAKRKLVMNVALGFDTFLVMRHGVPDPVADAKPVGVVPGEPYKGRLGCYYCNDVVAPMDSLTDRTLDQMCTVTRPGIASIASSTAVELMVSVLQHPRGSFAHSDIPLAASSASQTRQESEADPSTSSPLGIVPHQIRGFLAQFHNMKITGQAYDRCTGCSDTIVNAYEAEGFDMLVQAFEDASYLERLTGLDKLADESEALLESVDWEEEDDADAL